MPFETVKLNDGNEMPAIAFGTGSALYRRDATESVAQALETGFSHIDAAQVYENEKTVGIALKESGLDRSEFYVTTKYKAGPIRSAARESLSKLGIQYVDLYLVHQPHFIQEGDWKEFEKLKQEGLAKSIGVSNYNLQQLRNLIETATIKPAVNQIYLHPYNYADNKALLEYAAQHDIIIEAYGSLTPITRFPGGPVDAPIADAARRRGATVNQVIFLWVRAKGAVIVTTSSRKSRLEEYLAVADLDPLTKHEIAAIDAAAEQGPPSV